MAWHKPDNVAGSSAPAIMIGVFVSFGGLLFGYDTGSISGLIVMQSWLKQYSTGYVDPDTGLPSLTTAETAQVVSILSAGTFFGALGAAPFADRIGRRMSLIAAVGVFGFGILLQSTATALPVFTAGRFFAGFGVGNISVLVPLYQSEMAPKWVRGALVCAYQLAITAGLFVAAIVTYFSNDIAGSASYRIPVAIQFVWGVILLLGLIVLPETPRYLIKRARHNDAAASLSRIRRLDITHPALIEEIAEIEANHAYELSLGPSTYKDVFFGTPHLGRRLLTGCGLFIFQQLSGCNFIFYFGTSFFSRLGLGSGFLFQMISDTVNVVCTLPGIFLVESLGRRRLLMCGALLMAACQFVVAAVGSKASGDTNTSNRVVVTFTCLYIFFFASSWGPVSWVVNSEIYPLKVRAKSMSISTSSNWLFNWLIGYTTPYLMGAGTGSLDLGVRIFWIWGVCCLLAFVFVYFMVYETSKISLEQIDEMYERVDFAWNSGSFQPSWSFQGIVQESEQGGQSGISLADREEAARRAAADVHDHEGLHHPVNGDGDGISTSISNTSTSVEPTTEDKIIAELGHVDFSL